MYSEFETAKILNNCISSNEVMKVGGAFGFLSREMGEALPNYVRVFCHQRLRNVLK
jgi:hypothetical protein